MLVSWDLGHALDEDLHKGNSDVEGMDPSSWDLKIVVIVVVIEVVLCSCMPQEARGIAIKYYIEGLKLEASQYT